MRLMAFGSLEFNKENMNYDRNIEDELMKIKNELCLPVFCLWVDVRGIETRDDDPRVPLWDLFCCPSILYKYFYLKFIIL